jgi:1,4-dihydroxy-2-naphthoate octaprenyltransferase
MLPMVIFFTSWMMKVWKDETKADFKNSFRMNVLASCCTAICFLTIIIWKGFEQDHINRHGFTGLQTQTTGHP